MRNPRLEKHHSTALKSLAQAASENTDVFVHTLRELRSILFQKQFNPCEILDYLLLDLSDADSDEAKNTVMARYAIMNMLLDATRYASNLDDPETFSWEEFFNQWGKEK